VKQAVPLAYYLWGVGGGGVWGGRGHSQQQELKAGEKEVYLKSHVLQQGADTAAWQGRCSGGRADASSLQFDLGSYHLQGALQRL